MTISKGLSKYLDTHSDGANMRAVIDSNGFNAARVDKDNFKVVDPQGNMRMFTGPDLAALLQDALTARKAPEPVPTPETEPVADQASELEVSGDIELDNTGKRESKPKIEKLPKAPKENRYARTTDILLDNLSMTPRELANAAGLSSDAAGQYCIESFVGTMATLLKRGILPQSKKSLVTYVKPSKKPAVVSEQPAAGNSEPEATPEPLAASPQGK